MKKAFILLVCGLLFGFVSATAEPAAHQLHGKHQAAGLSCKDCHQTDHPTKRASVEACKQCHADVKIPTRKIAFHGRIVDVNAHDAHVGQLRCTLCHKVHTQPSELYCNTCHHYDIQVP